MPNQYCQAACCKEKFEDWFLGDISGQESPDLHDVYMMQIWLTLVNVLYSIA